MTFEIDNEKIGGYIANLIKQYYSSDRDFCRQYLKRRNIESNNDEVSKMANRLSQIKRGRKSIQIVDLPIFAELLHVSCEEILAGGSQLEKDTSRATNFTIAQSYDQEKWQEYIDDERKPILNTDEYEKTALEYAIEFENYDFIKFLVDKGYIWFDSGNAKDYVRTFGAGTSIQKKQDEDNLQSKLSCEDKLRKHIVPLAVKHGDIAMLKRIRARETPELYCRSLYTPSSSSFFEKDYNDKDLVLDIAKTDNEQVVKYFTAPIKISNRIMYSGDREDTFVYPYFSNMLDLMIGNGNQYLKTALKRAVEHNESVERNLNELIDTAKKAKCYRGESMMGRSSGDFIYFFATEATSGFRANIVKVTKEYKGTDLEIIDLIERLQNSYQNIMSMPMLKHLE